MVKINGIEAKDTNIISNDIKPSIKEILDRMENNFQARQINTTNASQKPDFMSKQNNTHNVFSNSTNLIGNILGTNTYQGNVNAMDAGQDANQFSGDDSSNLFFSLIPLLISKDKNKTQNFKNGTQLILKEIIKKANNPMLAKLMDILPKLTSKTDAEQSASSQSAKNLSNNKKIDDFVKADDYQNKDKESSNS